MQINLEKTIHKLFFVVLLPALSIGASWLFFKLIPNPPFWLETLSPLGAYGLLYAWFNNSAWKWKFFRIIGLVIYPDLNGRWSGTQISTFKEDGKNVETETCLEIKQNFSRIIVKAFYPKSESKSVVAVFAQFGEDTYLYYTYDNDPNSLKTGTMQNHKGTSKLIYLPKDKKLIGSYFNSIGNTGDISLKFENSETFNCFKQ